MVLHESKICSIIRLKILSCNTQPKKSASPSRMTLPFSFVFGFITSIEGIKVHHKECPNALTLQSNFAYRLIPAKWIDSSSEEYSVVLKLSGIDRKGLVNEVTRMISNTKNVDINKINFDSHDQFFTGMIQLSVQNKTILNKLVMTLLKVNGIDKIVRE